MRVQSESIVVQRRLAQVGKLARIGMFTKSTVPRDTVLLACIKAHYYILVKHLGSGVVGYIEFHLDGSP